MIRHPGRHRRHGVASQRASKQLVQHMRQEQQMIRDWADAQASQQAEIRKFIEKRSRPNRSVR